MHGDKTSPPPASHLSEEDIAFESGMIGREIAGRFRLLRVLGHGGFGSVFLAHQKSVDRHVAIKILRPSWSHKPQVAKRFLIEAKATSQLQNPHTVTLFDFGKTDDGLLYIAMEFLEGETLHRRMQLHPPLTPKQSVIIVSQIAESLAEAHDRGIVHRDLKPENVLLLKREDGKIFCKVLDFGIARSRELSDQMNLTQTGQFSGTPAYMSPEIIRSKTIGPESDVYSLGILLYQMLTGKCPFEGDNPFDVLTQHVSIKPKSMRNMVSTLPVRLDIFVQKCLSKRPQKRPADARAFLQELRTIERTERLLEAPLESGPRPSFRPTAAAATLAVVEETEEALRFSRNVVRWFRIWSKANPTPVALISVLVGVAAGGAFLFFRADGAQDTPHQPIAAASTYFPAMPASVPETTPRPGNNSASSPVEAERSALLPAGIEKAVLQHESVTPPEGLPMEIVVERVAPESHADPMLEDGGVGESEEPGLVELIESVRNGDPRSRAGTGLDAGSRKQSGPSETEARSKPKNTLGSAKQRAGKGGSGRKHAATDVDTRASILLGETPGKKKTRPKLQDKVDAFLD